MYMARVFVGADRMQIRKLPFGVCSPLYPRQLYPCMAIVTMTIIVTAATSERAALLDHLI